MSSPKLAQQKAENCAEELLKSMGIASLPVDPSEIARRHGILLKGSSSTEAGVSGFLMKSGDDFGIGYSTRINNSGLINFTIGHELGHYFLPGHVDHLFDQGQTVHHSKNEFSSTEPHEREADFFSAALLMPSFLFIPALRTAGNGFEAIKFLAQKCDTSLTATAIRYAQFAEDPIAVIGSAGNAIVFCRLSESLQEVCGASAPAKGDFLPSGTPTEKFNYDPANAGSCKTVGAYTSLDDWFEGAPQVEMKEDVVGLGSYGRTLTVLFTEELIENPDERE